MRYLAQFIDQLKSRAEQPCIQDGQTCHTYGELLQKLAVWQARLDQLKVERGAVIALRSDYSLHAVAVLLGLFARGAVAALIPRDRNAAGYLSDSCATAFLKLDLLGGYEWCSLTCDTGHPLIAQLRVTGNGGVIIFTSGSTGRPKAALHNIERFLCKFRNSGRQFRTLAFLLFDHVAGLDTLFYTLASGGTLILTRSRDPRSILQLIESCRVEVLPASPSLLRLLCNGWRSGERDLSSLKVITYGSEPMDASTLARLNLLFPGVQIIQKYGTTETGSPRSRSRGNDSLWLNLKADGVETKVIGGILWVRSDSAMLGYLNAPSPVDERGWYCTGDLVDVDGEWIRFCGRAVDIINVGGEKVAPVEVEQSILQLDFVGSVVVSGEPHALLGQIVTARVALVGTMDPKDAAKRIRLHCRQQLAAHKIPIKIEFAADGLVQSRQKLQRKRIAD